MLFGDEYLVEKQIFSSNRAPNIAQKICCWQVGVICFSLIASSIFNCSGINTKTFPSCLMREF